MFTTNVNSLGAVYQCSLFLLPNVLDFLHFLTALLSRRMYVYMCIYVTHAHTFIMENYKFVKQNSILQYFIPNCVSISKFKKFHLPLTCFIKSGFIGLFLSLKITQLHSLLEQILHHLTLNKYALSNFELFLEFYTSQNISRKPLQYATMQWQQLQQSITLLSTKTLLCYISLKGSLRK